MHLSLRSHTLPRSLREQVPQNFSGFSTRPQDPTLHCTCNAPPNFRVQQAPPLTCTPPAVGWALPGGSPAAVRPPGPAGPGGLAQGRWHPACHPERRGWSVWCWQGRTESGQCPQGPFCPRFSRPGRGTLGLRSVTVGWKGPPSPPGPLDHVLSRFRPPDLGSSQRVGALPQRLGPSGCWNLPGGEGESQEAL